MTQDNWISVEDDMPSDFVDVLGYHSWYEGAHLAVSMDVVFYNSKEKSWIVLDLLKNNIQVNITHWQPLPKPPIK